MIKKASCILHYITGTTGLLIILAGCMKQVEVKTKLTGCPPDMSFMKNEFCIESNESQMATFDAAKTTCSSKGRVLCSESDWYFACNSKGINQTSDNWEWVDQGDDVGNRKVVGEGGCISHNYSTPEAQFAFRCCVR